MKVEHIDATEATVRLSDAELRILNNALNEICHGIDLEGEFYTRIGAERADVEVLLDQINETLRTMLTK